MPTNQLSVIQPGPLKIPKASKIDPFDGKSLNKDYDLEQTDSTIVFRTSGSTRMSFYESIGSRWMKKINENHKKPTLKIVSFQHPYLR